MNYNLIQCPGIYYTILAGDTLYNIAARYNITLQSLLAANPQITNPYVIFPGQVICIPISTPQCPGEYYIVQPGDTLFLIAQRFNTTVEAILRVNPQITNPNIIFVGQRICIPIAVLPADCGIVLTLSSEAAPALPRIAGGVVLVQSLEAGEYALTFAATGIPSPETIGNFNSYIGTITIEGQHHSAILAVSAPFGQEPSWIGTRIIPFNTFNYPNAPVTIAPFNIEADIRGNPILGGTIADCKR